MKKLLLSLAALSLLGLVSCGTKNCRCYDYVGGRWTDPHTVVTAPGTPCNSLNNRTEACNEMDDPIIDPNDIGQDTKKK